MVAQQLPLQFGFGCWLLVGGRFNLLVQQIHHDLPLMSFVFSGSYMLKVILLWIILIGFWLGCVHPPMDALSTPPQPQ